MIPFLQGRMLLWAHNSHRAAHRPALDSGGPTHAPAFTRLASQVPLTTCVLMLYGLLFFFVRLGLGWGPDRC